MSDRRRAERSNGPGSNASSSAPGQVEPDGPRPFRRCARCARDGRSESSAGGLTCPACGDAIDPDDDETFRWVLPDPVVVHHGSPVESIAIAAALSAAGVPSAAEPEWSMLTGPRAIRRLVTRADAAAARHVIAETRERAACPEAVERTWTCRACAASNPGNHDVCWRCAGCGGEGSDAASGVASDTAGNGGAVVAHDMAAMPAAAMDRAAINRRRLRSGLVIVAALLVISFPTWLIPIMSAVELVLGEWAEPVLGVVGCGLAIGWLVWRDWTRARRGDSG